MVLVTGALDPPLLEETRVTEYVPGAPKRMPGFWDVELLSVADGLTDQFQPFGELVDASLKLMVLFEQGVPV